MLAVAYVGILVFFGDAVSRRLFSYVSVSHRVATAIVVGLFLGTWITYFAGWLMDSIQLSLGVADVLVASALLGLAFWQSRLPRIARDAPSPRLRSELWDWVVIGLFVALVSWMMLSTYGYADGRLRIASGLWSDFGPTTAVAQSFALGDNFPTEYPHYPGEPIRYHFLYYFQIGNLTHLGLDPALANNVLSIASMVSMLALVIAIGRKLFRSALVGRVGAALFFAHGSLSFLPLLVSYGSIEAAAAQLPAMTAFVDSGFPYRSEQWGIWTQIVYLNQRHLPSAIGVLLVLALFLLQRSSSHPRADATSGSRTIPGFDRPHLRVDREAMSRRVRTATAGVRTLRADTRLPGYVMCGILAGLLPLWNGAAFVAAAAMLGTWLVLFPERLYVVALGLVAASIGLPQLLLLGGAADASDAYPRVHWGYVVSDPTPVNVAVYVAFLFGPKLLLSVAALRRGTRRQRRVFLAFASLFAVAFLFQLSIEVFNNHKLINAWLVAANLFAAGGLVHLWRSRRTMLVPARLIAVALSAILVAGGLIDLIPIKNQGSIEYATDGDPLFEWLRAGTEKDAVFLSHVHVSHPITLAGRRLWLGHTFYAYSAGYDVGAREREYRDLFALRSARELGVRLRANDIQYVAFDDALRNEGFAPRINEELYRSYFEAVFVDTARRYSNLVIYRVPELASATALPGEPATNMYTGGAVDGRGLLDAPVGLAVDRDGTLLVADSGNGRIQRFSTNGNFVETIAGARSGGAELERPLGVASDAGGLLYVADPGTGRVTTFDAAGNVVSTSSDERTESWEPVDVAVIGDQVLVVDSLMGAVLRLNADGSTASWSDQSSRDARLERPSGIAIANGEVAVADTGNARVVIFDGAGKLLRSFHVAEWRDAAGLAADIAFDPSGRFWLSSPRTDSILAFDRDGVSLGSIASSESGVLDGPTGLAFGGSRLFVANEAGNMVTLFVRPSP